MAPRTFWKGYLKLSLVNCPVSMMPATSDGEKVRFHTLSQKTGKRVVSRYVDAVSGKPVEEENEVKGYEVGEDNYVLLEDDELDAVALESTRTIDIDRFVPADSVGWIWLDKPHYLIPRDEIGDEAFSVIRDAMATSKTVGIASLVLYRRERAVMLEPRGNGIVLWTLRYGDEVRDAKEYFDDVEEGEVDPALMKLVTKLIDERSAPWNPEMVADPVQAKLLEIISAKKKGRKRPAKSATHQTDSAPSNVVNIMDALKKSISSESKRKGS